MSTTLDNVFSKISVDYLVAGNARISWELNRHFIDPGPYTFQLQMGRTQLADADDWIDVGAPVVDTYFALDTSKRLFGKTLDVHYRVELTTTIDTYVSPAVNSYGLLSKRDWLFAREMTRKELLRHSVFTSPSGYLLKAIRYGPKCPTCLDTYTGEISNSRCPDCYGTGYENGYFAPLSAFYADVGLDTTRDKIDPNKGMDKQDVIQARFIGDTQLYTYDVWINGTSDERYYIHTVQVASQIRGVPIVYQAELKLAPFSDVVYTVPLDLLSSSISKKRKHSQVSSKWPTNKQRTTSYLELAIANSKRTKRQAQ